MKATRIKKKAVNIAPIRKKVVTKKFLETILRQVGFRKEECDMLLQEGQLSIF